jgi:hypothetical protein
LLRLVSMRRVYSIPVGRVWSVRTIGLRMNAALLQPVIPAKA